MLRAAMLVFACAGTVVSAQREPVPDTRAPVDELIARLDSPVFVARERATAELMGRRDLTLAQAEQLLDKPGLSPEQQLRLELVAQRVFVRGPRAALGIRFDGVGAGQVRVLGVVEEFPAAAQLRAGDEFLQIDGLPMVNQAACRAAILSHEPGESIKAVVRRAGREVELEMPLGSFRELATSMQPGSADLLAAWTLRRARAGAAGSAGGAIEPIEVDTANSGPKPEAGSAAWERAFATGDAPRWLRVGGQSRSGIDLSLAQLVAMDASRSLTLEDLDELGDADLAVQIGLLRGRRDRLLEDIEHVIGLIEAGNLDRNQMRMMRERAEGLQTELRRIEGQVRVLEDARRDRREQP